MKVSSSLSSTTKRLHNDVAKKGWFAWACIIVFVLLVYSTWSLTMRSSPFLFNEREEGNHPKISIIPRKIAIVPSPTDTDHVVDEVIANDDAFLARLKLPYLFHVIDNYTIQGSLNVNHRNKPILMTMLSDKRSGWRVIQGDACLRVQYEPGCEYCVKQEVEDEKCVRGVLRGRMWPDDRGPRRVSSLSQVLERRPGYNHTSSVGTWPAYFSAVSLRCELTEAIPHSHWMEEASSGTLRIVPPRHVEISPLSIPVAPVPSSSHLDEKSEKKWRDVLCGRPVYGSPNASVLAAYIDYYTKEWALDHVILYELGFARPSLPFLVREDARLRKLERTGRLVVIDLRDALQNVYGALTADAVMFTHEGSQMIAKHDCVVRLASASHLSNAARARWTLHLDLDEILSRGRGDPAATAPSPRTSFAETMAQIASAPPTLSLVNSVPYGSPNSNSDQATEMSKELVYVSFAAMRRTKEKSQDHDTEFCRLPDWTNHSVEVARIHRSREFPYPSPRQSSTAGYREIHPFVGGTMSLDVGGWRKYAVRIDVGNEPMGLSALHVHRLSACAYSANRKRLVDLHPETLYLRHVHCLNPVGQFNAMPMGVGWY